MRRAVLLILAQAHALRLARPPALKPKRLAKAATLTTAALAGGARKAWASGVDWLPAQWWTLMRRCSPGLGLG